MFFRFLEALFLIGMAGSVVVLAITTVEDLAILFERDEPAPGITSTKEPADRQASHEAAPAHAR